VNILFVAVWVTKPCSLVWQVITGRETNILLCNFHSRTVHLDIIKVFYLPTDAQENCFKSILKFTLKHRNM